MVDWPHQGDEVCADAVKGSSTWDAVGFLNENFGLFNGFRISHFPIAVLRIGRQLPIAYQLRAVR